MSRPRPHSRKRATATPADLKKQLRLVVVIAVLAAALGGILGNWDRLLSRPPEQVIRVYWRHGCGCVFPWTRSLEAAGFIVHSYESETLQHVRARLQLPASLHGCHLGEYLGYFVEGHVDASALRQLAVQRPDALGVVTQAVVDMESQHSLRIQDEHSPVLLVERTGRFRPWFQPENDRRG